MRLRRLTTAVGFALLLIATLFVAQATLGALLVLFSLVLRVTLTVQLLPPVLTAWVPAMGANPDATLYGPAVVGSFAFTAACGVGAAARRFITWRPAQ